MIIDPVCSCGHQEDEHDRQLSLESDPRVFCLVDGCRCVNYDPVTEGEEDE